MIISIGSMVYVLPITNCYKGGTAEASGTAVIYLSCILEGVQIVHPIHCNYAW
ncbi:hypothetical protein CAAN4_A08746 [[Candida] anglica]|uniref:Uncharacterized protein n=1 Tax=[Candida] anglica TaxID=148631 RepID=A0ABP0E6B0_9ASCO